MHCTLRLDLLLLLLLLNHLPKIRKRKDQHRFPLHVQRPLYLAMQRLVHDMRRGAPGLRVAEVKESDGVVAAGGNFCVDAVGGWDVSGGC